MLSSIPQLHLAESFSPDYMHGILFGVTRQSFLLWLDSSNLEQWYIKTQTMLLEVDAGKTSKIYPEAF